MEEIIKNKKRSAKPKGGSFKKFKPTSEMVKEVTEVNKDKVKVRVDDRTVLLVDPVELHEKGEQRIINEFNNIYFGPVG